MDYHPQDDLLVIEALLLLARECEDGEPDRADRAWMLAGERAVAIGLTLEDAVMQIDDNAYPI